MGLSRRALLGFVLGLPFALRAGASLEAEPEAQPGESQRGAVSTFAEFIQHDAEARRLMRSLFEAG